MPFLGVLSVMDERSPCMIPITQEKEIKDDKVLLDLLSPPTHPGSQERGDYLCCHTH